MPREREQAMWPCESVGRMVVGTKAQAGKFVPGKAVPSGWVSPEAELSRGACSREVSG